MKSRVIIVTGSISTGKSTVVDYLTKKNYSVIDSDKIAHILMKKGEKNYKNIVEYFGKKILDSKNEIDRKKLADIVFNDKKMLNRLNDLTHPNIYNKIINDIYESNEKIIFVDMPLFFENDNRYKLKYDEIWLVYVNRETQKIRLINRNSYSEEEAKKRIDSQINIEEKKQFADFIIDNSKNREYTYEQIDERLRIYENIN